MRRIALLVLSCTVATAQAAGPPADFVANLPAKSQLTRAAPTPDALLAEITQADAALFAAVFDTCDAEKVRALVTDDFEFHHDHNGRIAGSGVEFVGSIAKQCAARDSHSTVSRRELVADSLAVFPDGDQRAMETGIHRFYEHVPGKAEQLVGIARFAHVWRREDGAWRVERVLSFDHYGVATASP